MSDQPRYDELLRAARWLAGTPTLRQIQAISGVKHSTIDDMLHGRTRRPRREYLERVASALTPGSDVAYEEIMFAYARPPEARTWRGAAYFQQEPGDVIDEQVLDGIAAAIRGQRP